MHVYLLSLLSLHPLVYRVSFSVGGRSNYTQRASLRTMHKIFFFIPVCSGISPDNYGGSLRLFASPVKSGISHDYGGSLRLFASVFSIITVPSVNT